MHCCAQGRAEEEPQTFTQSEIFLPQQYCRRTGGNPIGRKSRALVRFEALLAMNALMSARSSDRRPAHWRSDRVGSSLFPRRFKPLLLLAPTAVGEEPSTRGGGSGISTGTQPRLRLICRCSSKGHLIFTDKPLQTFQLLPFEETENVPVCLSSASLLLFVLLLHR